MKQYYPLVDIIKFIFAILITCHHTEINLLINSGITSKIFGTSYLAVEGFLLISGYFLAASASSLVDKDGAWGTIIWKRIKRIYPVFLYCLLLFLIYDFVTYFVFGFHRYNFADIFSTIFMVGDVFFMKQIIGFWYMPVFFMVWISVPIPFIILPKHKPKITHPNNSPAWLLMDLSSIWWPPATHRTLCRIVYGRWFIAWISRFGIRNSLVRNPKKHREL